MSAPLWEAGRLYLPGALVQPIQAPVPVSTAITNPGFESGSTDWALGAGVSIDSATTGYTGTNKAKFTGTAGNIRVEHDKEPVAPGTSITASCMYAQGAADAGHNTGRVFLRWYTSGDVLISESAGNLINSSSAGWQKSTVTATAPATAAKVAIGCLSFRDRSDASYCDQFEWSYATQTIQGGLIYQAVQASPGVSGTSEPAWPTTLGVQVVDNEVTWEAVATSRVTWTASPILQSGTVEPTWPTTPGEFVSDGTISWECISRRVEDERCPNTKVVAIMAGKVFAVDGDIVRFSATANPLDWTSGLDAGFLPTGLQQANANDMAVLAPYRANLAAFNASSFQNWQVDPDPASMAILDQMDGVGSTWPKAATAVGNELFFLAALGVRTVGISAGAENLAAGDVGEPIDSLVRDAMRVTLANGGKALSTYYPGAGQYWLTFPDYPPSALSITGDVPDGAAGDAISGTYTVSGGVRPYGSVTVQSGTFPSGLTLDPNGSYSGTYTTAGSYSWVVQVTDADGNTATVADTAEVTAIPPWIATFTASGGGTLKSSPDGDDWTATPTMPVVGVDQVWSPGGAASITDHNGEILLVTGVPNGTSSKAVFRAVDGTYSIPTGTSSIDSSARNSLHTGQAWMIGAEDVYKSATGSAFSIASTVSGYGITMCGGRVITCGHGFQSQLDIRSFAPDGGDETVEGYPASSRNFSAVELASDASIVGFFGVDITANAEIWASLDLAETWEQYTCPVPWVSGVRPILHYGLGQWWAILGTRVAHGPSLDSLVLDPHVLPQIAHGVDNDSEKLIICGVSGMLQKWTLTVGWEALTSGVTTTIWDVEPMRP